VSEVRITKSRRLAARSTIGNPMEQVHALAPVILLLLVGILAITLLRPLGLSPIVGYLAAGLIIGPHALGLVPESATTHLLAELGVVFLLFDIGLHFSLQSIWDARRDILGLGPLQIALCGLVFGGIAAAFGFGAHYAIILGARWRCPRPRWWSRPWRREASRTVRSALPGRPC
jgi:CPA2 family monovalent cation:H+ antiporter-2